MARGLRTRRWHSAEFNPLGERSPHRERKNMNPRTLHALLLCMVVLISELDHQHAFRMFHSRSANIYSRIQHRVETGNNRLIVQRLNAKGGEFTTYYLSSYSSSSSSSSSFSSFSFPSAFSLTYFLTTSLKPYNMRAR